jgi:hypothetical protein
MQPGSQNESAYTLDRRAGKGSSGNSIPSVKLVGKNTSVFWAVSLSATTEVMLIVPTSTVLRGGGAQGNRMKRFAFVCSNWWRPSQPGYK